MVRLGAVLRGSVGHGLVRLARSVMEWSRMVIRGVVRFGRIG